MKAINLRLPTESETSSVKGHLRFSDSIEFEFEKISYPNLTLIFKDRTIFIERVFDKPYSAKEVENWAFQAVNDFANLLAFSNGIPTVIESISWSLTDSASGISVKLERVFEETKINRKGKVAVSSEKLARCFSWIGSSRALAFAIYEYNVALDESYTANQLFHLYKILEMLEKLYGGEKELISFLTGRGISKTQYKQIKRIMNEPKRFIRHAPNPEERIIGLSQPDLEKVWDLTEKILSECINAEEHRWIKE